MKPVYQYLSTIVLSSLFIFGGNPAEAQRDTTKLNQNVEVVKPYRPSISNVQKINLLPVIEDTTHFTPEFNYSTESYPFNSGFKAYQIGAAEFKGQTYKDNGIGYLKLGAGTYNTTYGDFFLNTPESKIWTLGLRLKHLASQGNAKLTKGDISNASYNTNQAEVFGSCLIGKSTLSSNLTYLRDMIRFYGYPDTIPVVLNSPNVYAPYFDTKQIFQKTNFNITLKSNEEEKLAFNYTFGFRFQHFDTKTEQQENSIGLFANADYGFEKFKGLIESSFDHFTTKGILISPIQDKKDGWLKLAPAVLFSEENLSVKAGVSFYSVFTNEGSDEARLYPKIDLSYIPVKDILTLYARLDGHLQNYNYSEISYENNWVNPIHNVMNADHRYIFTGGLKGKINQQISYNISAKYDDVKDLHYYILRSANTTPPYIYNNAFDVQYDNAGILNLSMELSYVLGKDYSIKIKGNYYNYSMENNEFAPLLPDFDLFGTANYRLNDRLTAFTDLMITGNRKGLFQAADETNQVYEMKPVFRINLGAEYELKTNLSIFGRIDNLLNQHYELLPGYNSLGLRLMAGVSLSF